MLSSVEIGPVGPFGVSWAFKLAQVPGIGELPWTLENDHQWALLDEMPRVLPGFAPKTPVSGLDEARPLGAFCAPHLIVEWPNDPSGPKNGLWSGSVSLKSPWRIWLNSEGTRVLERCAGFLE